MVNAVRINKGEFNKVQGQLLSLRIKNTEGSLELLVFFCLFLWRGDQNEKESDIKGIGKLY